MQGYTKWILKLDTLNGIFKVTPFSLVLCKVTKHDNVIA